MSGYIGNVPTPQATQSRDSFTATAGQTSFATSGYSAGGQFLDVHLNGVKLQDTEDYTATNGSDVVLTVGAGAGDTLEVVSFSTFEVADVYTRAEADAEFVSDPNGAVTVDGSGNVGIGTSSPTLPLSVDGDIWQGNTNGVEIGRITNNVGWYDFGASSNVNGAQMSHPAIVRFNTASTERMRIDSAGRVTMPYQPAWNVGLNAAQTISTAPAIILWDKASGNDNFVSGGVSLNAANGRITLPVSGKYLIVAAMRTESAGGSVGTSIMLRKNDVTVTRFYVGAALNSGGSFMNIEPRPIIIQASANDYLDYRFDGLPSSIVLSAATNTVVSFSGYLIG